ncbi:MAG TPA: hypothetical protein VFH66_01475 [Mycobacteriales bacterium]|nr:hypothetical protein [Mycobacteriales bacterium]
MTITATASRLHVSPVEVVLRVLAVAGLSYSAYVHLHLAHYYAGNGSPISEGDLFRAQGIVALVVAAALLVTGWKWAWLAAGAVGLASLAAVLTSRYTSLGAVGPFPNMHEATWQPSPDKLASAIAEAAVVTVVALRVIWSARAGSGDRQPVFSKSP